MIHWAQLSATDMPVAMHENRENECKSSPGMCKRDLHYFGHFWLERKFVKS
jgi:hypothetical protein